MNFCENYCELSCESFSMATSFNAEHFMSEPDQDVFDSLRKDDLLALSLYLNLNVKKSWRKIDIQKAIVKHLISADIFDESSLSSYCVAGKLPLVRGFTSPRVHNSAGSLLRGFTTPRITDKWLTHTW